MMPEDKQSAVFIGLGANLNDPPRQISQAMHLMPARGISIVQASALYESLPWGVTDQPNFYNLVLHITTAHTPHELMEQCLALERELGRQRREPWGPRVLDIDILAMGQLMLQQHGLQIPHPLLHQRAFVLRPWADLAPHFRVPGLSLTVQELWHALTPEAQSQAWHAESQLQQVL